jgi:hypothetical protein
MFPAAGAMKNALVFVLILRRVQVHPASPATKLGSVTVSWAAVVSTRTVELKLALVSAVLPVIVAGTVGSGHALDEPGNVFCNTLFISRKCAAPWLSWSLFAGLEVTKSLI